MRRALAEAGVPQPRYALLASGADVAAVARDVGLPCVVKPLGLSGSRGVIRADDAEQARSTAERRAELEERGLLWHRCTMEIERVRLGLRAAGTDPAACAHAAREGAAVLAAWSIDLEGERPGALARASRQLARSAELPAYTPAP